MKDLVKDITNSKEEIQCELESSPPYKFLNTSCGKG